MSSDITVVLLEGGAEPHAFFARGHNSGMVLAAQLAVAIGAEIPRLPGLPSVGAGGQVSFWSCEEADPIAGMLYHCSDGSPELTFFEDPIAALRAGLRTGGDYSILRLESPDSISDLPAISAPPPRKKVSAPWSEEICPRCLDHPLHLDPIFDDTSRADGSRICCACGYFESARLTRYGRNSPEPNDP